MSCWQVKFTLYKSYVRSSIGNNNMHYKCLIVIFNFPSWVYSRGLRIFIVTFYMNLGSIANFVQLLVFYFKLSGPFYRNEYLHYIYIYTIVFLWYMNISLVFFFVCVMILSLTFFVDRFSDGRPSNSRGQRKPEEVFGCL